MVCMLARSKILKLYFALLGNTILAISTTLIYGRLNIKLMLAVSLS